MTNTLGVLPMRSEVRGRGTTACHSSRTRGQAYRSGALHPCDPRRSSPARRAVLSPVGVRPDLQRRGIGSALITTTLGWLRERALRRWSFEGHPTYYPRSSGFVCVLPDHMVSSAPSVRIPVDAFMVHRLPAYEPWMTGALVYPDASGADAVGLRISAAPASSVRHSSPCRSVANARPYHTEHANTHPSRAVGVTQ